MMLETECLKKTKTNIDKRLRKVYFVGHIGSVGYTVGYCCRSLCLAVRASQINKSMTYRIENRLFCICD